MDIYTLTFSLLLSIALGVAAGYVGSIMIMERMALVGDALSHVALPGLAIGILLNFNPFLGAFAFLFAAAVVIWQLRKASRLSFETLVGVIFTLCLAIGIFLIPTVELLEALFGDITTVTIVDATTAIIVTILVILVARLIYQKITLSLISEELAVSEGINVSRVNLVYLLLVALVVAIGIKVTGTILVGMLVVTPAAAAKNISSSMHRYFILSSVFGAISAFAGVYLTYYFNTFPFVNIASGPLIVFSGVVIFAVTLVLRRWWVRRHALLEPVPTALAVPKKQQKRNEQVPTGLGLPEKQKRRQLKQQKQKLGG
jgi:ABC-type Mn2+/Zn2+ transport system permease subunit